MSFQCSTADTSAPIPFNSAKTCGDSVNIIHLFEDWLHPHLDSGGLKPILEPWWQRFPGPFLYYPGGRLLPAPLRAFVDFIKAASGVKGSGEIARVK